ncbi:DUF1622 domain-containing protein [Asticcacaulis sp. BYS171W]|uniref:DUF1622 domain-containing protein n=1 Tax=Asticcacaulis aquaticus TaxID=2984212 RepID=A0ABT5HW48_9CAUL|nr:DUF1622 domain-containing protein [Asticcacaulis aquaticus]MDC7684284.1 DUF1622 domain-containing protein [Asticcacaulis aquaticus]
MTDSLKAMFAAEPVVPTRDWAFEVRVMAAVERRRFRRHVGQMIVVALSLLIAAVALTPAVAPVLDGLYALPVFVVMISAIPAVFAILRQARFNRP